jgi:N-acetylglutamate synthase-like GNAT family acetyltransferase
VNLIIRTARPEDADVLHSLYRQLVDDENVKVTESQIRIIADDARTRLLICEVDGIAKGTVLVCLCADAMYSAQPFAVIENLVVDGECRGSGIGQALMLEVERFCVSQHCSKIMLLSSAFRVNAHQFFEQIGFRGDRKRGFVKYRSQFGAAI